MNHSIYNIYLNSPQLALHANNKKYYEHIIQKNKKKYNQLIIKYPLSYYNTSYNLYYYPNIVKKPSI
jgi:hypothetical protein